MRVFLWAVIALSTAAQIVVKLLDGGGLHGFFDWLLLWNLPLSAMLFGAACEERWG